MLKDILREKGISVYKLSKDTDISYSTLNDIVLEKTDLKNASANMLYRLSKYLGLSMEALYEGSFERETQFYLDNDGRNVILQFDKQRVQFLGPKNLIAFHRIHRVQNHVLYVSCYFEDEDGTIYTEEDYIDLVDVLDGFDQTILDNYRVHIGNPNCSARDELISNALMVSDNIAILFYVDSNIPDQCVKVHSLARPNSSAIIRLSDLSVVSSNMSEALLRRSVEAVQRNLSDVKEEVEEVLRYA